MLTTEEEEALAKCPCESCQRSRERAKELGIELRDLCERCGYYAADSTSERFSELCVKCLEILGW